MENYTPGNAPIVKGDKLKKLQWPQTDLKRLTMKDKPYATVVGCLNYAHTSTRPDLTFVTTYLGKYQSNPRLSHWQIVKMVLTCLQETKDLILTYRILDQLEVVGFSDSDFVKCLDTRKSISGYVFQLVGGAISWCGINRN